MSSIDNSTGLMECLYRKGGKIDTDQLTVSRRLQIRDTREVLIHISGLPCLKLIDPYGEVKPTVEILRVWRDITNGAKPADVSHVPLMKDGCGLCISASDNYVLLTAPGDYAFKFMDPEMADYDIEIWANDYATEIVRGTRYEL